MVEKKEIGFSKKWTPSMYKKKEKKIQIKTRCFHLVIPWVNCWLVFNSYLAIRIQKQQPNVFNVIQISYLLLTCSFLFSYLIHLYSVFNLHQRNKIRRMFAINYKNNESIVKSKLTTSREVISFIYIWHNDINMKWQCFICINLHGNLKQCWKSYSH